MKVLLVHTLESRRCRVMSWKVHAYVDPGRLYNPWRRGLRVVVSIVYFPDQSIFVSFKLDMWCILTGLLESPYIEQHLMVQGSPGCDCNLSVEMFHQT
jgi:hypothetical protein